MIDNEHVAVDVTDLVVVSAAPIRLENLRNVLLTPDQYSASLRQASVTARPDPRSNHQNAPESIGDAGNFLLGEG